MCIKNYIKGCIDDYLNINSITATDDEVSSILTEVLSGYYAFQIIYTFNQYTGGYILSEYKILDHTKMTFSEGDIAITPYWTYKREKHSSIYGEHEILFIDKNIIRDIKLEFELNI